MKNKEVYDTDINLMYGVNDNPSLAKKILFGIQHIFAAFGGIIVVPLVIASALGLDAKTTTTLISATILASGLATIIQAKGVGKVGSRVACIMGTDFTFVSPAISVGSVLGLPGIIGATIAAVIAPMIICPCAPIEEYPLPQDSAAAKPAKIIGVALVKVDAIA